MSTQLLAILAGLASAVGYGVSDFGGGFATRRNDAIVVVLVSQSSGMILLLLIAFFVNEPFPPTSDLLAAAVAGILGTLALVRFYQELASGRMGIVAPSVAVVTVTIPVLFSALTEGLPQTNQIVGIVLAILAIWFITRTGNNGSAVTPRDMAVILIIGLMFSSFLVTIGTVSERSVLWPLVASRIASIFMVIVVLVFTGRWGASVPRGQLPLMSVVGFLDVGGSAFYAVSSALGRLDIAAVIASLYPAVTVVLANIVLSEEIGNKQWLGITIGLAAIVLITF